MATNSGEFTATRISSRSAGDSLFASTTTAAGSPVTRGFRVAVARGRPTCSAAVRVEIPRAVSSR